MIIRTAEQVKQGYCTDAYKGFTKAEEYNVTSPDTACVRPGPDRLQPESSERVCALVHRRIQLILRAIANLLVCQGLGFGCPESSVCVAALGSSRPARSALRPGRGRGGGRM